MADIVLGKYLGMGWGIDLTEIVEIKSNPNAEPVLMAVWKYLGDRREHKTQVKFEKDGCPCIRTFQGTMRFEKSRLATEEKLSKMIFTKTGIKF